MQEQEEDRSRCDALVACLLEVIDRDTFADKGDNAAIQASSHKPDSASLINYESVEQVAKWAHRDPRALENKLHDSREAQATVENWSVVIDDDSCSALPSEQRKETEYTASSKRRDGEEVLKGCWLTLFHLDLLAKNLKFSLRLSIVVSGLSMSGMERLPRLVRASVVNEPTWRFRKEHHTASKYEREQALQCLNLSVA